MFVDANNCFHGLRALGLSKLGALNYARISKKLVGPREWVETRFYVGQVRNEGNTRLYDEQRQYLGWLTQRDPRISIHLWRLESHRQQNPLAVRLKRYMADLKVRIDPNVFQDLVALGNAMEYEKITQEKAVDVALAVDLVMMAQRNDYQAAYLLSADGDFTPAVNAAKDLGKRYTSPPPRTVPR